MTAPAPTAHPDGYIIHDDDNMIYPVTRGGTVGREFQIVFYRDKFGRDRHGHRHHHAVFDTRGDAERARDAIDEAFDL